MVIPHPTILHTSFDGASQSACALEEDEGGRGMREEGRHQNHPTPFLYHPTPSRQYYTECIAFHLYPPSVQRGPLLHIACTRSYHAPNTPHHTTRRRKNHLRYTPVPFESVPSGISTPTQLLSNTGCRRRLFAVPTRFCVPPCARGRRTTPRRAGRGKIWRIVLAEDALFGGRPGC